METKARYRRFLPAALAALLLPLPALLPAQRSAAQESAIDSGVSISIDSNPRGASVEINGARAGSTPLTVSGYAPGSYSILVSKEGFRDRLLRLNAVDRTKYTFMLDLEPRLGILRVEVDPPEASILIDGEAASAGERRVGVGRHAVTARLFGYVTQEEYVEANETFPESLSFKLEKADFAVTEAKVSRPRFNPGSPGSLGSTSFSFVVSAPGSGELSVESSSGEVVARRSFRFDDWEQSFSWNGKDLAGKTVGEGEYLFELLAKGDDGIRASAQGRVEVDESARIEPRSLSAGIGGYALCPSASTLPGGYGELGAGLSFPLVADPSAAAYPFWAGLRMALMDQLEVSLSVHSAVGPGADSGLALSGGLKLQFLRRGRGDGLDAAAYLSGTAALPGPLPALPIADSGSSLRLGLPLSLSAGAFDATLSPGYSLAFPPSAGLRSLLSLSAALGLQSPFGDVHLSANATYRIGSASIDPPALALDARYMPSWAPLSLGAGCGLAFLPSGGALPSLSLALGLLL